MEFGVFLPIANNGWIMSRNSPQYMPTFQLNKEITQIAEDIGFDFALSMVKWRGFGGDTRHWDFALESMSLMSALAAVTSKIDLYASVQPLTMNPAVFAKMAATIDDVSGGRFGVNIVSGWARQEYDQLGVWPGDEFYDYRYDYAEEWINIVKGLWANGRYTYKGRFLSVDDCYGYPQPNRILPIVCAGMSERGIRYTVENGDANFIGGQDLETVSRLTNQAKSMATGLGKTVKTYGLYAIVYGETDEEARAVHAHHQAGADEGAREGWVKAATPDKNGATATMIRGASEQSSTIREPYLMGSADTIAARIVEIQEKTPLDGMLFTFPDFVEGMTFFGEQIMPRLRDRGLKRAAWKDQLLAV
jgi:pyrimidine oxygenase